MKALAKVPLVFVIFDGWGLAPAGAGNAITSAKTPVMDGLFKRYPWTSLKASGSDVGLPKNQEGNSEAGHMNIGAGRIVEQDAVRISRSINEGRFFKNAAFTAAIRHVQKYHSQLHLMGLLTGKQSGHADTDHLLALLAIAREHHVKSVVLHLFTDGRDSPPHEAVHLLRALERQLRPNERVGTVIGRLYAMDRKKVWPRIARSYNALVSGIGKKAATAEHAILESYEQGKTDEFIEPIIIGPASKHRISSDDSVIFFNLRSDRARELTKAFVQEDFNALNKGAFRRKKVLKNLVFVAMTDFGPDLGNIYTAFPSVDIYNTLPMMLRHFSQLYIAETEKYAHITFFLNGGYNRPIGGEDRTLVPSPDVMSYDEAPAMSAAKITSTIVADLRSRKHDIIVLNFANPDMVGHTGNLAATIKAVEIVDACVGRIRDAVLARHGVMVITSDHGNAESMLADDGKSVETEHSTNPVPFIVVTSKRLPIVLRHNGRLADVSPTILDILGIQKPVVMTGLTLITHHHAA